LNGTFDEITVSVILTTYSAYFTNWSQPFFFFVEVWRTTSRVKLVSLVTPVNTLRELFRHLLKKYGQAKN